MMPEKPRLLKIIDIIAVVLLVAASVLVFFYAPTEKVMGLVQKIFYFHVASNWVGMLSFVAAAATGIGYLRTNDLRWDVASLAAVELGMVFMVIGIITGSIWARPIWNTWWTWDPRLTTTTIMLLVYAAYLMLRQGIDEPEKRARFGAVYVIVGALSVPLTFFSIRYFRTIHPVLIGDSDPGATGAFDMVPMMLQTFMFSLLTYSVIFISLYWHRIRLGNLAAKVEQLKLRLG